MSETEKIQDSFNAFHSEVVKLCAKFRAETGMGVMGVQVDCKGISLTAISGGLKFELSKLGSRKVNHEMEQRRHTECAEDSGKHR